MPVMILKTHKQTLTSEIQGSWSQCIETFRDNVDRIKPRWGFIFDDDGDFMERFYEAETREIDT